MTTTIQEVLSPLFITCHIMGLGVYPIKEPKSRIRYLSVLYALTVWFVYGYLLYYTITIFTRRVLFGSITSEVAGLLNNFTSIASAIRFDMCMKKLAAVDDTLEKLGTPKMYRKVHIWSKCVVIGWIVYIFVTNIYSALWWFNIEGIAPWSLFVSYIILHPGHINTFMDLLFIFFLRYIGIKFDKVNEYVRYLLVKEEHELRFTWKKPIPFHQYSLRINNYKRTLWTSMHLHLELCRISRELNWIFGIQITFKTLALFLYLTAMCYYFFNIVDQLMHTYQDKYAQISLLFCVGIWALVYLIRFYIVNYTCESVMIKANEIQKIIHQLTNTLRYADVLEEIHQFTLQTMQHPLKFTGMGLFYLGSECLRKLSITVVTFVIIMIQLKIK